MWTEKINESVEVYEQPVGERNLYLFQVATNDEDGDQADT